MDYKIEQKSVCEKYSSPFTEAELHFNVGISKNFSSGARPINGLRHPNEGDTSGWYIWFGEEYSESSDFFVPMHIHHLIEICPMIFRYLGLAPGWRFLVTKEYEDVWYDEELLNV